jgi:hypothetical protein
MDMHTWTIGLLAGLMTAAALPAAAQLNSGRGLTGLWLLDQTVYDKGGVTGAAPLNPAAQAAADAQRKATEGGAVLSDANKRCAPHGMPGIMSNEFALALIESPGVVTVISEDSPLTRHISLTRKAHMTDQDPGWVGDSIAHWDGKIMVVETTNLNDRASHIPRVGSARSLTTKITERLHLEKEGKVLVNAMTFEDPAVLTGPWTITYRYHRGERDANLWEYACEVDAPGWSERFAGDPQYMPKKP